MEGWINEYMHKWALVGQMDELKDVGWMDELKDVGWMDGWMEG